MTTPSAPPLRHSHENPWYPIHSSWWPYHLLGVEALKRADVLVPMAALAVGVVLAGNYLDRFKNWIQFRTGASTQAPTIAQSGAQGLTVAPTDTNGQAIGAPLQIVTGQNLQAGQ